MNAILYSSDMPITEGLKTPVEAMTFAHTEGETLVSIKYNYNPPPALQERLGLVPILNGQPCCGWFMYRATKNFSHYISNKLT